MREPNLGTCQHNIVVVVVSCLFPGYFLLSLCPFLHSVPWTVLEQGSVDSRSDEGKQAVKGMGKTDSTKENDGRLKKSSLSPQMNKDPSSVR